jgi:hypothetical protein
MAVFLGEGVTTKKNRADAMTQNNLLRGVFWTTKQSSSNNITLD